MSTVLLATDIQYSDNSAMAAGILFFNWKSKTVEQNITKQIDSIVPYEPGSFYKRELPCILEVLSDVDLQTLETIVVDGYVHLGATQKAGLGMHLYEAIDRAVPVVGVAKNRFAGTPERCEILRGISQSPLYVTSVGMPLETAKANIVGMHGKNRMPTLLKKVDQLCRGIVA